MKLARLKVTDFNRLVDQTRLQERARQIAREVLVDGRDEAEVAAAHDVYRQYVHKVLEIVRGVYVDQPDVIEREPFYRQEVYFPADVLEQLDKLSKDVQAKRLPKDRIDGLRKALARLLKPSSS